MKIDYILSHSLLDPVTEQVAILKQDLGVAGYGTLWSLIEMLIASDGLTLSLDYATLCQTMKCDRETLRSVVEDYSIFTLSGDHLSCTYVTEEVEQQNARSIKRRERAKKAARARWGSPKSENNATSIEDKYSKHKETNACSITSSVSDGCFLSDATSIPSRSHVRSCARAKRKNTSYSVSKPEKINYPPYTPLLFSRHEKVGRYVTSSGAGGYPITAAIRRELLVVRRELEELKRKLNHPQKSRSEQSDARPSATDDEIVATLEKPWQELVREWVTYRRELGSPIRGKLAIGKFYDRLRQLSGDDPSTARQIINRSIANGYKGIDLRTSRYTSGNDPFRTDDNGRVVDSTVGQDYNRKLSIRDCFRLKAEGRL